MMVACVSTGNWRDSERECFCVGREVVRERERQNVRGLMKSRVVPPLKISLSVTNPASCASYNDGSG